MNTTKIARLYPYFLTALNGGCQQLSLLQQLEIKLRNEAYRADEPSYHIKVMDTADKSHRTDEFGVRTYCHLDTSVPARVFAWVGSQLPAQDAHVTGQWGVMTMITPAEGQPSSANSLRTCYGPQADFEPLLRGLRAYQGKLRKEVRKLVHQLWAYHAQQQLAEALPLAPPAPAQPTVPAPAPSYYSVGYEEFLRRTDAAKELEEKMCVEYERPDTGYGREIMWHPAFPAECVASFSNMPLYEVEAFLGGPLEQNFNNGRPLDLADYRYLADVLREGLADNPTQLAALRLMRALAWVEQADNSIRLPKQAESTPMVNVLGVSLMNVAA